MISLDEVRHIAKLSKINLSEEEVELFAKELTQILDYFELLNSLDTSKVEETSQVTGMQNIHRKDVITMKDNEGKALLECSPHSIENNSIKIPKIH